LLATDNVFTDHVFETPGVECLYKFISVFILFVHAAAEVLLSAVGLLI